MSQNLRHQLRSLRADTNRIKPDAAWVRATRETLVSQVTNNLPEGRMSWRERWSAVLRTFVGSTSVSMGKLARKPAMAILSLVALIAGGSMFSVSAAERSLPGDLFYSLKLVTEQARLALTATTEDKLKLKTEFTDRRVTELRQISTDDTHRTEVAQVTEILKRDLSTLKQQLADVTHEASSDKAIAAAKLVDQKTNEVITALQETKSQLSPESKEKVTEAQSAAADAGVRAIEVLAEKHQETNDRALASDIAQAIQDHAKVVSDATLQAAAASGTAVSSSTFPVLPVAVSSTEVTSSTLPNLVSQIKDMTTQAFALQKAQDQLEIAAASGSNPLIEGSGTPNEAGSSTSPVTSSTSLESPLPSVHSTSSSASSTSGSSANSSTPSS